MRTNFTKFRVNAREVWHIYRQIHYEHSPAALVSLPPRQPEEGVFRAAQSWVQARSRGAA